MKKIVPKWRNNLCRKRKRPQRAVAKVAKTRIAAIYKKNKKKKPIHFGKKRKPKVKELKIRKMKRVKKERERSLSVSSATSVTSDTSEHSVTSVSNKTLVETDFDKISDVMRSLLEQKVDYNTLEWNPITLWIKFDGRYDDQSEYAMAPTNGQRIAGSCHELLVIYIRSKVEMASNSEKVVYKRLLKLARDQQENNKDHFEGERKVARYLSKMASTVNHHFAETRTDVCIWPVESVQFEYKGVMTWGTVQAPFLPEMSKHKVFTKVEPNNGEAYVKDPIVGRYQHMFAAITRGLYLLRDWQGYGVSQSTFLSVCDTFNVNDEATSQIKICQNEEIQRQKQVLVVIDPVLISFDAHYGNHNELDFGLESMDEWKESHQCRECRCNYYHLLPSKWNKENEESGLQFGIGDPDQIFFNHKSIPKGTLRVVKECRKSLGIWCGESVCGHLEIGKKCKRNRKKRR